MDTKKKIMPQINSEEQPIKFKSGTIAGKGSKPRPGIYTKEYRDNFDKIFGVKNAKKSKEKSKSRVNEAGNYTKPSMRKRLFRRLKPVLKVVNPVGGQLEKPSFCKRI